MNNKSGTGTVRNHIGFLVTFIIVSVNSLFAGNNGYKNYTEQNWAVGMSHRSALIPFDTDGERFVGSIVPLIFFEGERWYFRGITGGYKFYKDELLHLSTLGRLHFFDAPEQYQNMIQGGIVDWGVQARLFPLWASFFDLEILADWKGNTSSNIRAGISLEKSGFRIDSYAQLKIKSSEYNSYFYGLTMEKIGWGIEPAVGLIADYHVGSNLYLYASAQLTWLDKNVRNISFVRENIVPEFFVGFGFSNDKSIPRKEELKSKAYLRLAHGWASLSSLNEILRFKNVSDPHNNKLSSIFYGHPLTDNLFGFPLDIYLTSGFVWHWKSGVQSDAQEVVLVIKFYYTIPWPARWRIGFAEGWSYVNTVPYVEKSELVNKDLKPSNLLNYLDVTFDVNIGDIFGGEQLKHWWLGYSLHHRSGIFGSAQQFGRISGGSNYNTIYLQYHF